MGGGSSGTKKQTPSQVGGAATTVPGVHKVHVGSRRLLEEHNPPFPFLLCNTKMLDNVGELWACHAHKNLKESHSCESKSLEAHVWPRCASMVRRCHIPSLTCCWWLWASPQRTPCKHHSAQHGFPRVSTRATGQLGCGCLGANLQLKFRLREISPLMRTFQQQHQLQSKLLDDLVAS